MGLSKKNGTEFSEEGSLQWFGEKVGKHGFSVTMCELEAVGFKTIRDPKMADVNVSGTGTGRGSTVFE